MQSSSQIVTLTNQQKTFCRPDALSVAQPTAPKEYGPLTLRYNFISSNYSSIASKKEPLKI